MHRRIGWVVVMATLLLWGRGWQGQASTAQRPASSPPVSPEWAALEAERDWELDAIALQLVRGEPNAQRFRCVYALPLRDPNAFVSEQGEVVITEGLLERLEGRDEIAFVLAHELAHLLKGHPRNLERNPTRLERLRTEAERGLGGSVVGTGLSLLLNAVASYYSREREREADEEAVRLMAKAGFDPQAAERALQRLGEEEGLLSWFRSHPFLSERKDIVRKARRRWRPVVPPPTLSPPDGLPPEVFVAWQIVGDERHLSPDQDSLWQRLMAETQRWFWAALMDATQQGSTPFRPAKRWQRHRAQTVTLRLRLQDWRTTPIAGMDGWWYWQIQVRCRLEGAIGGAATEGEVRFGTALTDTESLPEALVRSALPLARRFAQFVVQNFHQPSGR